MSYSSGEVVLTSKALLRVKDLWVKVENTLVLKGVNLTIGEGEVHTLLGPNASGKSSLLMTIMGIPKFKVIKGEILYGGVNITKLPPHERAKMGIALAFQNPPRVNVKLRHLINRLKAMYPQDKFTVNYLNVRYLLDRELYHGFSGGEAKKVELYVTMLQSPKLALLDEPDSGIDVESLVSIANFINKFIESGMSMLIVTHLGSVLKQLNRVDVAHVMVGGRIIYSSKSPLSLLKLIYESGYSGLVKIVGDSIEEGLN